MAAKPAALLRDHLHRADTIHRGSGPGTGQIVGTVKERGTPDHALARRELTEDGHEQLAPEHHGGHPPRQPQQAKKENAAHGRDYIDRATRAGPGAHGGRRADARPGRPQAPAAHAAHHRARVHRQRVQLLRLQAGSARQRHGEPLRLADEAVRREHGAPEAEAQEAVSVFVASALAKGLLVAE